MGATSVLFVVAHFTTEACVLCRTQQFLMVALLCALGLNVTDKRPFRFLRLATWLAGAGVLIAATHWTLSTGLVADPCAGLTVCAHEESQGASRATPAVAAPIPFAAVLALVCYAMSMRRRPGGPRPV